MNGLYFGRNVDGGTFPADIWGDYMGRVKGSYCGDFAPPEGAVRVLAVLRPLLQVGRRRQRDGRPARRRAGERGSVRGARDRRRPRTRRTTTRDGAAPDEGTGFDPGAYEAPPQPEPDTVAPPPADGDGGATAAPG